MLYGESSHTHSRDGALGKIVFLSVAHLGKVINYGIFIWAYKLSCPRFIKSILIYEYNVTNHGFGGSKVADSTYFYDRLVTPFSPEVIVIFAGTNDIHGMTDSSKEGKEVFEAFKIVY